MVEYFSYVCNYIVGAIGSLDIMDTFFFLFALPVFIFIILIFMCAFSQRVRTSKKGWYNVLGSVCAISLFCFCMCKLHNTNITKLSFYASVFYAMLNKLLSYILYNILSIIKGDNPTSNIVVSESNKHFIKKEEFPPRTVQLDIKLEHALGMISLLKDKDLNEYDELEISQIENNLFALNGKKNFTEDEARTLNDELSSLIKFMSKYNVNSLEC